MTNPGPNADKSHTRTGEPLPHKTPLWVKGFLIAAAVLVLAFAVIHLSGGTVMNHSP